MRCFLGPGLPRCNGEAIQFYVITTGDGRVSYCANCKLHLMPEESVLLQWQWGGHSVEFVNEAHIAAMLIHQE